MKKALLIAIFAVLLAFFLFQKFAYLPASNEQQAIKACISLCKKALQQGVNLSNGPCLSDIMPWNFSNWVCDVAHWPRQSIDNLRQNQCNAWWQAYQQGKKINFVEVDPNCNFIRTG